MSLGEMYDENDRCKIPLSLIVVTRGDVDLTKTLRVNEWVCVTETIVWDNSNREDLGVFGRYAAIEEAKEDVILVVDDDVYLWPQALYGLCAAYKPGHLIANMPAKFRTHYPDSCLVGFGAIFDRDLPARAFEAFRTGQPGGWWPKWEYLDRDVLALFHRECDAVFSTLTPRILVDEPYDDLPWAYDANRLWKQPDHSHKRKRMLDLARKVRVPA